MNAHDFSWRNGKPGALDPSFADHGSCLLDFEGYAQSMIVSSAGGWVIGLRPDKNFALVRLGHTGQVVPDFGDKGFVFDSFSDDPYDRSALENIVELPDGTILVLGSVYEDDSRQYSPAAARYDARGQLDRGFGDGGKIVFWQFDGDGGGVADCSQATHAERAVSRVEPLLQAKGEVIFHFYGFDGGASYLVSLDDKGQLNSHFGGKGFVRLIYGQRPLRLSALLRQHDDKVVFAGYGEGFAAVIGRMEGNGFLDKAFADQGFYALRDSEVRVDSLFARSDRTLFAAGTPPQEQGRYLVLLKLDAQGKPDSTFNAGKALRVDVPGLEPYPHALAIDSEGRWCLAGGCFLAEEPNTRYSLLIRFLYTGALDSAYGNGDGVVVGPDAGEFLAMQLEHDDRAVVVGHRGIFPFFPVIERHLA